jgi:hypothetical protein
VLSRERVVAIGLVKSDVAVQSASLGRGIL